MTKTPLSCHRNVVLAGRAESGTISEDRGPRGVRIDPSEPGEKLPNEIGRIWT
jgi:hypothetical protein